MHRISKLGQSTAVVERVSETAAAGPIAIASPGSDSCVSCRVRTASAKGKEVETESMRMWVDKYRPDKFTDLLGDEVCLFPGKRQRVTSKTLHPS